MSWQRLELPEDADPPVEPKDIRYLTNYEGDETVFILSGDHEQGHPALHGSRLGVFEIVDNKISLTAYKEKHP